MTCQMPNLFRYFTMVLIWTHMLQVISQGSVDMLPNLRGGAWDPHNHNSIAAISDSSLHLWDLRSMELILYLDFLWFYMLLSVIQLLKCFHCIFIFICERVILRKSVAIEHAHIRDVDYNPKKQNIIVSTCLLVSSNSSCVLIFLHTEGRSLQSSFWSNVD